MKKIIRNLLIVVLIATTPAVCLSFTKKRARLENDVAVPFFPEKDVGGGVKISEASEKNESDTPLHLGNPSRAKKDERNEENFLMEKTSYSLSYNNQTLNANWVAWHLSKDDLGNVGRDKYFYRDDSLPRKWYAVNYNDFQFAEYGFERGHLCPSADRTSDAQQNSETFYMTNIVPQSPENNQTIWNDLEMYARKLAQDGNELYIFAGTHGTGGSSEKGELDYIQVKNGRAKIRVPAYLWKVIVILKDGDGDISRIDKNTKIIAVMMPNANGCSANRWQSYIVSVDEIEAATGLDFLDLLDDEIEDAVEVRRYIANM